ncbi:MAG: hypothetical protein U0792_20315 [Gemmataceae bacterium]
MAFSLRAEEVPVNAKMPNNLWFGYTPALVPFHTIAKIEDQEKLKAAQRT